VLTRATLITFSFCYFSCVCLSVVLIWLSVSVQLIDWKDSKLTCNVSVGTLNHSLTLESHPDEEQLQLSGPVE